MGFHDPIWRATKSSLMTAQEVLRGTLHFWKVPDSLPGNSRKSFFLHPKVEFSGQPWSRCNRSRARLFLGCTDRSTNCQTPHKTQFTAPIKAIKQLLTLPKTNIGHPKRKLVTSIPTIHFQVRTVSFREGSRVNTGSPFRKRFVENAHLLPQSWGQTSGAFICCTSFGLAAWITQSGRKGESLGMMHSS